VRDTQHLRVPGGDGVDGATNESRTREREVPRAGPASVPGHPDQERQTERLEDVERHHRLPRDDRNGGAEPHRQVLVDEIEVQRERILGEQKRGEQQVAQRVLDLIW